MVFRQWRALGVGFAAGALAALAMPPLFWFPLAVLGIVVFVWQWSNAPDVRSALLRGWAWGVGHFAVGSYWIVEAFYVPPAEYGPLGVPIVAGLAIVLGFFPGIAAAAARWLVLRWPHLGGRYRRLLLLADRDRRGLDQGLHRPARGAAPAPNRDLPGARGSS